MEVMETEKLLASSARVDVVPRGSSLFVQIGDSKPTETVAAHRSATA